MAAKKKASTRKVSKKVDLDSLKNLWGGAFKKESSQTLARFGGVNFRVNIAKALRASWHTLVLHLHAAKAAATGFTDPLDLIAIASEAKSSIIAALDAVREQMKPLEYLACLALSKHKSGIDKKTFQQELEKFLQDLKGQQISFPWYLAITKKRIDQAITGMKSVTKSTDGFAKFVANLQNKKWIDIKKNKICVREKHLTWGFSES